MSSCSQKNCFCPSSLSVSFLFLAAIQISRSFPTISFERDWPSLPLTEIKINFVFFQKKYAFDDVCWKMFHTLGRIFNFSSMRTRSYGDDETDPKCSALLFGRCWQENFWTGIAHPDYVRHSFCRATWYITRKPILYQILGLICTRTTSDGIECPASRWQSSRSSQLFQSRTGWHKRR